MNRPGVWPLYTTYQLDSLGISSAQVLVNRSRGYALVPTSFRFELIELQTKRRTRASALRCVGLSRF